MWNEAHMDVHFPAHTIDIPSFRERRVAAPLLPYENLEMNPRHKSSSFSNVVEARIRDGYERDGESIPSLSKPIDWEAYGRSFSVRLHSWEPITELLMFNSLYSDERSFEIARSFAFEWINRFQAQASAVGPDPIMLERVAGCTPWYDMAVGRRAYRLAYILDVLARNPSYDDQLVMDGFRCLDFHLLLLSRDDFFRADHNHGFYQALGELAAIRRFRNEQLFGGREEAALRRVERAIDQQFLASGIHREHSPEYHFMVMGSLIGARASGLVDSDGLRSRIAAIEAAMQWLIQPNGCLLTFGDSSPRDFRIGEYYPDRFQDPNLRYHLSRGQLGNPPSAGILALPEEGYAIARSGFSAIPDRNWWYLAQIAAFHSRAHKHADDLSFVWSDRGVEILTDPGRYAYGAKTDPSSDLAQQGFWYSDPKRIYVESTRAHNTVEIDGRSYDRRQKPYGSALRYAGEQDGLIVTECDVTHFQSVRHWRLLVMAPGRFLLTVDCLHDAIGRKHDFRQYFHLHPNWLASIAPSSVGSSQVLIHNSEYAFCLLVVPLIDIQGTATIVRGQVEQELLGWHSDKSGSLIPSNSLFSEQCSVDSAVFATLFTFANAVTPCLQTRIDPAAMSNVMFMWEEDGERLSLEISRDEKSLPIKVALRRQSVLDGGLS